MIHPYFQWKNAALKVDIHSLFIPLDLKRSCSSSLTKSKGTTRVIIFIACQFKRQFFILKDTVSPLSELRPNLESR